MKTTVKITTAMALLVAGCISAYAIVLDENFLNNRSTGSMTQAGSNTQFMLHASKVDDVFMPVVYLPEVEISAEKSIQNQYATTVCNGQRIASVNLPEVTITASYNYSSMHPVVSQSGEYVVLATLPSIEIPGQKLNRPVASAKDEGGRSFLSLPSTLPLVGAMLLIAILIS